MGIFDNKEQKLQLYFYEDNSFEFKKRPLEHFCLLEKDGDDIKRAWKHFYGNEFYFPGYKSIPAGMVTLGYARDIILDPFDKIPKGTEINQKPGKDQIKEWISKIAENMRHVYRAKRNTMTTGDKVTWVLIGVLVIETIGWFIRFMTG